MYLSFAAQPSLQSRDPHAFVSPTPLCTHSSSFGLAFPVLNQQVAYVEVAFSFSSVNASPEHRICHPADILS
jgi:hypothetical protein